MKQVSDDITGRDAAITTLDADLGTGDPVRIQARADDLRLLQQVAPVEIEPSIGVLLAITDDFARTAGTATDRAAVADEVFRGRSGDITAIEAAGDDVATYTASTCQIDLDGAGSTSVPGSSTAETAPGATGDPGPTTTTIPFARRPPPIMSNGRVSSSASAWSASSGVSRTHRSSPITPPSTPYPATSWRCSTRAPVGRWSTPKTSGGWNVCLA